VKLNPRKNNWEILLKHSKENPNYINERPTQSAIQMSPFKLQMKPTFSSVVENDGW
jgi:hypothetical protein